MCALKTLIGCQVHFPICRIGPQCFIVVGVPGVHEGSGSYNPIAVALTAYKPVSKNVGGLRGRIAG